MCLLLLPAWGGWSCVASPALRSQCPGKRPPGLTNTDFPLRCPVSGGLGCVGRVRWWAFCLPSCGPRSMGRLPMPGPQKRDEWWEQSLAEDSWGDTGTSGVVFHLLRVVPHMPWGSQRAHFGSLLAPSLIAPSLGPICHARALGPRRVRLEVVGGHGAEAFRSLVP